MNQSAFEDLLGEARRFGITAQALLSDISRLNTMRRLLTPSGIAPARPNHLLAALEKQYSERQNDYAQLVTTANSFLTREAGLPAHQFNELCRTLLNAAGEHSRYFEQHMLESRVVDPTDAGDAGDDGGDTNSASPSFDDSEDSDESGSDSSSYSPQ